MHAFDVLGDPVRLREVIAGELNAVRERFANERRTQIVHDPGDLGAEDLIDAIDVALDPAQSRGARTAGSPQRSCVRRF